jgi:hypothetical protein
MTYIVFHKDTPKSTIDWHVARVKPAFYYTGVPPKWEALAEAEGWTFPRVVTETEIEGMA